MDRLADLIKGSLDKYRIRESAEKAEILFYANRLFSERLSAGAPPVRAYKLLNGTLFLAVSNSVSAQEAKNISEDILSDLQKKFGTRVVLKICIKSLTIP